MRRMPNENSCLFCDASTAVARNALAYVRYDQYPVSPGHCLVVPLRHVASYFDTTPDEKAAMLELVEEMKATIDEERAPAGYNVGVNVGKAAGQSVMHVHIHLIPRYTGDMDDPRGGVRGVIPEKQKY